MNSNFQKSSTEMNKTTQISSVTHNSQRPDLIPNQNAQLSPMNRVSILKTEEQREIVRTNVFEPNLTASGNEQQFCVVTEVVKRNSNIPLDSKANSFNKIDIRFSFNKTVSDPALNPTFQNQAINIGISDSKMENKKIRKDENYKLLIKRIATQLRNKIRPPTHGFFFFALQKGQYPFIIIRKLENQIMNHSIDLNSDIFRVYTEKYFRYMELIRRIAHLLKQNLTNKMFWENDRYKNQSIQVKVVNKSSVANTASINTNVKNISNDQNTIVTLKKNNNTIKSGLQNQPNKKIANVNAKSTQINQNNAQKKIKTHTMKTNNNMNNPRNNMSHPSISQTNIGSHRLNNVVNPFNTAKNQNQKKSNITKKTEPLNKNNNLFNKSLKNKNMNNINKTENTKSASSETNKTGNIKFMNIPKNQSLNLKDSKITKEEGIKHEKTQIINISKKAVTNNMINIQKSTDPNNANNDIVMKDETEKINQDINLNNNTKKTVINLNKIPHRNTTTIMSSSNLNDSTINEAQNNSSIIRQNNVKKITFDSIKSPGKKLQIKISTLKKPEDIIKSNVNQIPLGNKPEIPKPIYETAIDISTINVPISDKKITDEHISFVNKFNILLSSNGIDIEYNIPLSKTENGINNLKKSEFWEKYIHYLYMDYVINKRNKISIFTFAHLIEQYYLWCEICDSQSPKSFKKLIIDYIHKIFSENEISQFLSMNKISNLDELFTKYEIFNKYGNNNSFKTNKEIEIKIDNVEECNCDLCKNEKACIKKITEMNKKSNINVNIENILIEAEYSPKDKNKENKNNKNNQLETDNYFISFAGKNKNSIFSKSKTLHSFESVYQYIPPKTDIDIEEKIIENKKKSVSKKKKSKSKVKRSSKKEEKNEKENFIDLSDDEKKAVSLDENEKKKEKEDKKEKEVEKEEEEKEVEKEEIIDSDNKSQSRKKNSKKNNKKNKKRNSYLVKDDTESETEEEKDKKKDKKKKKQKSKSRNKSYSRKYPESNSESESEESDNTKNKNKKSRDYPRRKKGKSKW